MRCHYDVLALERDASPKEVKKAFHVQALRWHPDKHQKNKISPEEATLRFQEIQSAYEVLSDAHERKWYDDHREQILRGDADNDGDDDGDHDGLNLFKYFSPRVYSGFGKDAKSFYSVYSELFQRIDELDIASVATASSSPAAAPVFGDSETPIADVNAFYQHWSSYLSQRSFAWVDEYKTTDAPSRQIRRAMEKENKKLRDAAKRAFTSEVRELVDFVRRRDQRLLAFQKQKEKERAEQKRAEEARKQERQAAYEAERLAFQEQEQARWASMEQSRHAQDHIDDELAKMRKKLDADLLLCDLCRKTFKSPKQLQNHLLSKKHRDMELELGISGSGDASSDYFSIEAELEREIQAELAAAGKKPCGGAVNDTLASLSLDDDGDEDHDDARAAEDDPVVLAQREKEAEAARAAEQARLLKDQKAAEKRRERKEQRKQQKKDGVEKLVSGGKGAGKGKKSSSESNAAPSSKPPMDDFTDSEDEGRGRRKKGSKGKKRS